MDVKEYAASGPDYLDLVTALLQRARLDHPTRGLWEAADLQWWWRQPRSSDCLAQTFWLDGAGDPLAAVVLTDWGGRWGCDAIFVPSVQDDLLAMVWARVEQRLEGEVSGLVEIMVEDGGDNGDLRRLVTAAGFEVGEERGASTWMPAAAAQDAVVLASGYRLMDRGQAGRRPHHMIPRGGPDVQRRLESTSLYRPDLDLWVEAADSAVAAYGLFWLDPITSVGFVEPMRTEESHYRRGLARHLLDSGLHRLVKLGARRLKVNYELGNPVAERLYLSAGFEVASTASVFTRDAG